MDFDDRLRAIHVIQRFVKMSRALLPMFSDLMNKTDLEDSDKRQVENIQNVYDNFHADPEISVQLMNSNIVGLIQDTYEWLNGHQGQPAQLCSEYQLFIDESDRLIHDWETASLN